MVQVEIEEDQVVQGLEDSTTASSRCECHTLLRGAGAWPIDRPADRASTDAWLDAIARHCAIFWKQAVVDLDGYDTEQSADDLDDLRRLSARKRSDSGPALAEALGVRDLGEDFRAPLVMPVPPLFLSGDRDGRTYVESHRELAAGFENAVHDVVEGAGHDLFMASPEVGERIRDFLAGRPTSDEPISVEPISVEPITER